MIILSIFYSLFRVYRWILLYKVIRDPFRMYTLLIIYAPIYVKLTKNINNNNNKGHFIQYLI